jgi:cytochrome c biogenesis protein CcmG, thiol:disulfide interchange protein DsbE
MSMINRIESSLPLIIFFICIIIIAGSFFAIKPQTQINLEGKKVEELELFSLISKDYIKFDQPLLLHLFATWCINCKVDHQVLVGFKNKHKIKTIGIIFDDIDDNILSWLRTNQDIYDDIVKVTDDQFFISLAIKNIPETFLLAKDKTILFNHTGELKEEDFDAILTKYSQVR